MKSVLKRCKKYRQIQKKEDWKEIIVERSAALDTHVYSHTLISCTRFAHVPNLVSWSYELNLTIRRHGKKNGKPNKRDNDSVWKFSTKLHLPLNRSFGKRPEHSNFKWRSRHLSRLSQTKTFCSHFSFCCPVAWAHYCLVPNQLGL